MSDATSIEQRLAALESVAAQHKAFLAQHEAFVAQHEALAAQWEQERDEYRKLISHLREENERLRRGLLGQKAERLPKNRRAVVARRAQSRDAGPDHSARAI